MHCMLMDLLHGFEVLSTTEETLFNSRNVSRLVDIICLALSLRRVREKRQKLIRSQAASTGCH